MTVTHRVCVASFVVLAACTSSEPRAKPDGGLTHDAEDAAAPLGCEATAAEWYDGLIATPAWRECSTDEQCVLARNDAQCTAEDGDLRFAGCGLGISTRASDDYEQHRAEREAALCARPDRPRCNVGSACGNLVAFCDDGRCSERFAPGADEVAALAAQCASRPLDECDADDRCYVLEGTRIDLERECAGSVEPAACITEWRQGGSGAPVCIDDPDGATWLFPMGVPVMDWTEREQSDCLNLDPCE